MSRFQIDADIAKARTLPTSFYKDEQLFGLALEKLFAPSWQFIGDTNLVPTPGDAYPLAFMEPHLAEPLVLVRGQDKEIRLLSNVCTHRGNILVGEPCRVSHLRCRYHGRIFNLDGT